MDKFIREHFTTTISIKEGTKSTFPISLPAWAVRSLYWKKKDMLEVIPIPEISAILLKKNNGHSISKEQFDANLELEVYKTNPERQLEFIKKMTPLEKIGFDWTMFPEQVKKIQKERGSMKAKKQMISKLTGLKFPKREISSEIDLMIRRGDLIELPLMRDTPEAKTIFDVDNKKSDKKYKLEKLKDLLKVVKYEILKIEKEVKTGGEASGHTQPLFSLQRKDVNKPSLQDLKKGLAEAEADKAKLTPKITYDNEIKVVDANIYGFRKAIKEHEQQEAKKKGTFKEGKTKG
jgi:hypothetical protein